MLSDLRKRLSARRIAAEQICVEELVREAGLLMTPGDRDEVVLRAIDLVTACRENSHRSGTLDAFLHQFGLNNAEGVALMCLAEALLRIPDEDTADRLIAEKIRRGDWQAHLGESESVFVNASIWGLMLTGRLVTLDPDTLVDPDSWVRKLVSRAGEPIVRSAVMQAMRIIGGQFVLGRSIDEAMARGVDRNARFSFDMLGEGARTDDAAEHYFSAYLRAIDEIAERETHVSPDLTNGISIKLSALHPRYEARQRERVMRELTPRLKALALAAKQSNLGINIDAEEAARLDLSLDLFETLARDPDLAGWSGLGFVVQAYQKRAPLVVDWLVELARQTNRRFMVRLVKGAYWDAEIKHAQEQGLTSYPVYTRKANTDLSYEVCAGRLLAHPDQVAPQFATHNAHTVCMVEALAHGNPFEFQRLHGMGHMLFDQLARSRGVAVPLRVYAPVGKLEPMKTCFPTWCGVCSKTAPTVRL